MNSRRSIEYVFLLLMILFIFVMIGYIIAIFVSVNNFHKAHPEDSTGTEWSGLALFGGIFFIIYLSLFLLWQFRLLRRHKRTGGHAWLQEAFIFIFGIFPFLTMMVHMCLVRFAGIEEPFTEKIIKGFLWLLLFPFTGGR